MFEGDLKLLISLIGISLHILFPASEFVDLFVVFFLPLIAVTRD